MIIVEAQARVVLRVNHPRAVPHRPSTAILDRFNQGEFAHPFSHGVSHDRVTLATWHFDPIRGRLNRDGPPTANFIFRRVHLEATNLNGAMERLNLNEANLHGEVILAWLFFGR